MNPSNDLRQADHLHLWHPYTDATTYERGPFLCIDRAEGVYLHTADGQRLLDGIASWWCVALGHGHPHVVRAIQDQAARLQHCILATLSHAPAIQLAERLAALAPGDLNHVYFAADGSSVVDAALKMARQYWIFAGQPQRTRFISLRDAYHGDSLGAIGVGFMEWFQQPYGALVVPAHTAPSPFLAGPATAEAMEAHAQAALAGLANLLDEHGNETAAIIIEPLCQAAAGIRIYPESYLRGLRALCDAHGVLLIADEIATGLGRTGAWLACDRAGIVPDIVCLGKALTAGYLPLSATIATTRIYDAFRSDGVNKRVFWDGHTFCGNPITAAAALATLEVFEQDHVIERAQPVMAQLDAGFARLAQMPGVTFHRGLGMIAMCALSPEAGGAQAAGRICARALELGLFVRPLGEVLYLWPPLVTSAAEMDQMLALLEQAIHETLS